MTANVIPQFTPGFALQDGSALNTALAQAPSGPINLGSANAPGVVTMLASGNAYKLVSGPGVSPGATGADNVLASFALPANAFDITGRGIAISAYGSFAANGNNKRLKIIVNPATAVVGSTVGAGGVTLADTGTVTTNGAGWGLAAELYKYGAAGSNTQIGVHVQAQEASAVASMLVPSLVTAVESGVILVAITGNASTTATDILLNVATIEFYN